MKKLPIQNNISNFLIQTIQYNKVLLVTFSIVKQPLHWIQKNQILLKYYNIVDKKFHSLH